MTGWKCWKYIRKNLHNVDTWPLLVLERAALGHADLNLDSVHPILAICTLCFVKLFSIIFYGNPKVSTLFLFKLKKTELNEISWNYRSWARNKTAL